MTPLHSIAFYSAAPYMVFAGAKTLGGYSKSSPLPWQMLKHFPSPYRHASDPDVLIDFLDTLYLRRARPVIFEPHVSPMMAVFRFAVQIVGQEFLAAQPIDFEILASPILMVSSEIRRLFFRWLPVSFGPPTESCSTPAEDEGRDGKTLGCAQIDRENIAIRLSGKGLVYFLFRH